MSKRSHLSRWEDLKRGFIDIGRFRYILHKFDMESWRDQTCPVCNFGFGKEPNFYMEGHPIHNDCSFTPAFDEWVNKLERQRDDNCITLDSVLDTYESTDDAYNAFVAAHGEE